MEGFQHQVTVNLESALRQLRKVDEHVNIWVDALSINQSNVSERTEQVNLMHDIFSSTEEVIVYLGELPNPQSMSSKTPVPTSTTSFQYNNDDEEKPALFRSRCSPKQPLTTKRTKLRADLAVEIFCFLRTLTENPGSSSLPGFDVNSGEYVDRKYQRISSRG